MATKTLFQNNYYFLFLKLFHDYSNNLFNIKNAGKLSRVWKPTNFLIGALITYIHNSDNVVFEDWRYVHELFKYLLLIRETWGVTDL